MCLNELSQAEYTNLETLWDRVNDAINTIIRREETNESGDLLPPCVEGSTFVVFWLLSWFEMSMLREIVFAFFHFYFLCNVLFSCS